MLQKRVITYGTFDLFHEGHRRILERAKALGDYLVVGVTSDAYDESRGKLDVSQSLVRRIENVRATGLADEIIVEEYQGQKIRYNQDGIDVFAIGSDWINQFDYLKDYCEVVYLDRTRGVSSTQLRSAEVGVQRLGIVGAGRIAKRFVSEARYVSGVDVVAAYTPRFASAQKFVEEFQIQTAAKDFDNMLKSVDAIYIASPHRTHYEYAKRAIQAGVHVLCEKPISLTEKETAELFELAKTNAVVLLEAIKTSYAPGFHRLVALAKSGTIGSVRSVDATFTKLVKSGREFDAPDGGSITELASYPLLAIIKILGNGFTGVSTTKLVPNDEGVDTFARIDIRYPHATASARVGLGVKAEGELVIAGTKGYIYVPAPWWLTSYFEERFEDPRDNRRHYFRFDGDGLRYEIAEFFRLIRTRHLTSHSLSPEESIAITSLIESARADNSTIIK